jgi:uncharacterized protein
MLKQQWSQLIVLTVISFALMVSVVAQDPPKPEMAPAKRALIAELLQITEVEKTAAGVYQGLLEQQRKMSLEVITRTVEVHPDYAQLSDEDKERVKREVLEKSTHAERRVQQLIDERVNFPKLIEEISYQLYDKYFTEQELKDLIDFYKSPTGKKATAVVPKLFAESMELVGLALQPKLQEVITIFTKEESERVAHELEVLTNEESPKKPAPPKRRSSSRRRP